VAASASRPSKIEHVAPRPRFPSRHFRRSQRLLRGADFARLLQQGRRLNGPYFSLIHLPGDAAGARLGLAVSRRVSPQAVVRNRIKRAVRECFRHRAATLPPVDVMVLVRPAAASLPPGELREALARAFVRLAKHADTPDPSSRS